MPMRALRPAARSDAGTRQRWKSFTQTRSPSAVRRGRGSRTRVGLLVRRPEGRLEATTLREPVAERPQHLVREAAVEVGDLFGAELRGADRISEPRHARTEDLGSVGARPRDPHAAPRAQHVVEGDGEPADGAAHTHAPVGVLDFDRRAVRYDDQSFRATAGSGTSWHLWATNPFSAASSPAGSGSPDRAAWCASRSGWSSEPGGSGA